MTQSIDEMREEYVSLVRKCLREDNKDLPDILFDWFSSKLSLAHQQGKEEAVKEAKGQK